MAVAKQPKVTFNNGSTAPALAFGTWQGEFPHTEAGRIAAYESVKIALDVGYRHIDTSPVYMVEENVGQAITEKIEEGILKREDLFVTTKLWGHCHRPDLVEGYLRTSLKDLQLDYVDLYLIHWPMAFKEGEDSMPLDVEGKVIGSDVKIEDTWKAMEDLVKKGLAKNIGLSNFNSVQVDRILIAATIKPVTNQVECHPYMNQEKLSKYCNDRGVTVMAYAPLGSPGRCWADPNEKGILENDVIKKIAKRHGKSPGQIILRYQIDRGHLLAPKSANKNRLIENFDITKFSLTEDDVKSINGLNKNLRLFSELAKWTHLKEFPFHIEY